MRRARTVADSDSDEDIAPYSGSSRSTLGDASSNRNLMSMNQKMTQESEQDAKDSKRPRLITNAWKKNSFELLESKSVVNLNSTLNEWGNESLEKKYSSLSYENNAEYLKIIREGVLKSVLKSQLIGNLNSIQFKRKYISSRDGVNPTQFHAACGRSNNLLIVVVNEGPNGSIYGGFTHHGFPGCGDLNLIPDSESFLFTLKNPCGAVSQVFYPKVTLNLRKELCKFQRDKYRELEVGIWDRKPFFFTFGGKDHHVPEIDHSQKNHVKILQTKPKARPFGCTDLCILADFTKGYSCLGTAYHDTTNFGGKLFTNGDEDNKVICENRDGSINTLYWRLGPIKDVIVYECILPVGVVLPSVQMKLREKTSIVKLEPDGSSLLFFNTKKSSPKNLIFKTEKNPVITCESPALKNIIEPDIKKSQALNNKTESLKMLPMQVKIEPVNIKIENPNADLISSKQSEIFSSMSFSKPVCNPVKLEIETPTGISSNIDPIFVQDLRYRGITEQEFYLVKQWLNAPYSFKLIYEAVTDGDISDDFHKCCDGLTASHPANRRLLIFVFTERNVFGAFTNVGFASIQGSGDFSTLPDNQSFLFTLKNSINVPPTIYRAKHGAGIKDKPCYTPCFAAAGTDNKKHDLYIRNKPFKYGGYSYLGRGFHDPNNHTGAVFSDFVDIVQEEDILNHEFKFQILDFIAYECSLPGENLKYMTLPVSHDSNS